MDIKNVPYERPRSYKVTLEVIIEADEDICIDTDSEIALINNKGDAFYPLLGFEIDRNDRGPFSKAEGALSDDELDKIGITIVSQEYTSIRELEACIGVAKEVASKMETFEKIANEQ